MTYYWALLYAFALLSRVPMPFIKRTDSQVAQASLWFYPLVGLVLGATLLLVAVACVAYHPKVPLVALAGLLLFVWVIFTGAIHLDGLGDTADAWVGGMVSRERTLEIMQDPRSGAMGVVAIVTVLILKFSALLALLQQAYVAPSWNIWLLLAGLVWVPAAARASILPMMASLTYVRAQGMASQTQSGANWLKAGVWVGLLALLAVPLLQAKVILVLLFWCALVAYLRYLFKQRLGGYTGDLLGATVELLEAFLLLALVL